jgi:hypothetical protein
MDGPRDNASYFSGQPELLQSSSMLVLDNVSTDDMARDSWAAIEHTVRREAMGMLVLGGPRSFSLGGYRESVLESLLPVISEPPTNEPPANVIFLIDVSGSMDQPTAIGSRLDIARQAVIDTARTLRPIDRIGLMSFAIEAQNHLALTTRANHGEAVEGSWPKIASGGTNLVPAMAAAIDGFERSSTEQDILVVLTDGYVSDADLEQLENLLAGADVEIIALIVGDTSRSDNIGEFVTTIQEYGNTAAPSAWTICCICQP